MMALVDGGFLTPEPMLYHARARGFVPFDGSHLCLLALSALLVVVVVASYLRLAEAGGASAPAGERLRMLRVVAGIPVAIVAVKCVTYLVLGVFEPLFWPLHVCNLCELAALGYALAPRSRVGGRLADLLFCWGLTGCPCALLLPGWSWYCPAFSLASLCGFVEHALVLACAVCVVAGGSYVPDPRRGWFVLVVTIAGGAAFRVLNPLLGTNFFFVTNPAGAGGPLAGLVQTFGNPGFLVPYLALAVAAWALAYGAYRLASRLRG